jgi:hypothetical protein
MKKETTSTDNPFVTKEGKGSQDIINELFLVMDQLRKGEITPAQANKLSKQIELQSKELKDQLKELKKNGRKP